MKNRFLNILTLSVIITAIGFLMDGDVKEPGMGMRFIEFFGMTGILFILISGFYFGTTFIYKTYKRHSI